MKLFLPLIMFAEISFAGYGPDARFEIFPSEGEVISIGCNTEDNDECKMETFSLSSKFPRGGYFYKRLYPGIGKAPRKVVDGLVAAADALGDVTYVHVAITHEGTTYEYMYDRDTGWNSFRSMDASKKCRLECKVKVEDKEGN